MFLKISEIKKSYGNADNRVQVIRGISTEIEKGEMCIIFGQSGSGKSTFLNLIGGIDTIDSGSLAVDGVNISELSHKKLSVYRREYIGFIFQFYNLVPNLTIKENIQVCEYLTDNPLDINELIHTLGLEEHINKFPYQLSGGQQQKCAIARALIKNPKLLLCDEPTGALDSKSSKEILVLIEEINRIYGTTILIVSHNTSIKDMVNHVINLKDGYINRDYINESIISAKDIDL